MLTASSARAISNRSSPRHNPAALDSEVEVEAPPVYPAVFVAEVSPEALAVGV